MTINPFIPYLPIFLSFFLYGFLAGFVLQWWRKNPKGCFLGLLFYYAYAVLLVFMALLLIDQSNIYQLSFLLGASLPFFGRLSFIYTPFVILMEKWIEHQQEKREQQRRNEQAQYDKANHEKREQNIHEEQVRREAEARARRAEQERSREQANQSNNSQNPNTETRSNEQILGLSSPWTQEELKAAYKREAGRTHPDKWIGKPEAIRQAMELEYKAIQEAYRNLKQ